MNFILALPILQITYFLLSLFFSNLTYFCVKIFNVNTIKVFLEGTEMVIEAVDRSDHEGVYFHKVRRLLVVQNLESSGSNWEIYLVANREPVQSNHD